MVLINETILYKNLGEKIKDLREKKGSKLEDFAKEIEISRASLANYESGTQPLGISTLYRIAAYLNISLNEILPPIDEVTTSLPEEKIEKDTSLGDKSRAELLDFIEKAPGGEKK